MLPPKFALQKIYSLWCYASNVKTARVSEGFVSRPEANTQGNKFSKYMKELRYQRELSRSKDTNKHVVATHVNQLRLCGTEHENKVPFAEKQRKFT
jgi:hypothetical protein